MFDFAAGKAGWTANGLPTEGTATRLPRAGDLAHPNVPTCDLDASVERIRAIAEGWPLCVVIDEHGVVLGRVRQRQLAERGEQETAEQIMDPGPGTFRPDVPRQELRDFMREHDLHTTLITTAEGSLVGMVKREDLEPPARGTE